MNCKYTIKTDRGDIIIPSVSSEKSLYDLKASMMRLDDSKLQELKDALATKKNDPQNSSWTLTKDNVPSVVATVTMEELRDRISVGNSSEELSNVFGEGLYTLVDKVATLGNNLNVVFAKFKNEEDKFLGSRYFNDSKLIVADIDELQTNTFDNLFKSFIESSLHSLVESKEFRDEVKNISPSLRTKDNILKWENFDKIIPVYSKIFGIDEGTLNLLYDKTKGTITPEQLLKIRYDGKNLEDLQYYTDFVKRKYLPFVENKDLHYGATLASDKFPSLHAGDLIKYNVDKFDTFGLYINSFVSNNKTYLNVLLQNGERKSYPISKFIFDGEFKYRKLESTKVVNKDYLKELYETTKEKSKKSEPGISLMIRSPKLSKEFYNTLKHGDSVILSLNGTNLPFIKSAEDKIFYARKEKNEEIGFSSTRLSSLSGVNILLDNHPEIKELIEKADKTYWTKLAPISEELVSIGDVLKRIDSNGVVRHNYIIAKGENEYHTLVTDKTGTKASIVTVPFSNGLTFYRNYENYKKYIWLAKEEAPDLREQLEKVKSEEYFTHYSEYKPINSFNIFDISHDGILTSQIKDSIKEGDYINYNDQLYIVSKINKDDLDILSIENLENGVINLETININDSKLTHVLKKDFYLSPYDYETELLNRPLLSSREEAEQQAKNMGTTALQAKYVIKTLSKEIWNNNEAQNAYWIDINKFNTSLGKYIDLTDKWMSKNWKPVGGVYLNKYGDPNNPGRLVRNTRGLYRIRNAEKLTSQEFINNAKTGGFIDLQKSIYRYRIEGIGQDGIFASYAYKNESGDINTIFKFISKEQLTDDYGNLNIYAYYLPSTYSKSIEELQSLVNSKNSINSNAKFSKELDIKPSDSSEIVQRFGELLSRKYSTDITYIRNSDLHTLSNQFGIDFSEARAFNIDGNIFINLDKASIEEPLHEIMHLLIASMRGNDSDVYYNLIANLQKHPAFKDIYNKVEPVYQQTRSQLLEETLVRLLTGNVIDRLNGAEFFQNAMFDKAMNEAVKDVLDLQLGITNTSALETLQESPINLYHKYGAEWIINSRKSLLSNRDVIKEIFEIDGVKDRLYKGKEANYLEEKCNG